jgi:2-polyprenyl-6-methoxyphenol hydroxylase-like FAD-dependent oxidoreductase
MVPNAVGVLRRLGVHVEDEEAVLLEQIRLVKQSGELLSTTDIAKTAGRWQNKWFLAHRAHLHKHLKEVATSIDGKGRPVLVHTSSKVAKADPHRGTIVLLDGTQIQGDLIVGADGVHSVTRAAVTKKKFLSFKSGHSAMRFLITKESALADPVTRDWATPTGSMDMWYGPDLKIVLYPCVNNTLFNFVCIHPAALSNVSDDYNQRGSKEKLLEIYRDFEPRVLHLLEKVDDDTLKVYPLFDMETLPTFVNDRLALIGDAAHPFTPHLAQGGAMAIEDAISLGVMLPLGTTPDEIPERLKLYNQARYERATTIQNNSRLLGNGSSKRTFPAFLHLTCRKLTTGSNQYTNSWTTDLATMNTTPRLKSCVNTNGNILEISTGVSRPSLAPCLAHDRPLKVATTNQAPPPAPQSKLESSSKPARPSSELSSPTPLTDSANPTQWHWPASQSRRWRT